MGAVALKSMHIVDEHARVSRPDSCASLVGRRQVVCCIEREVEYKFSSLDLLLFDSTQSTLSQHHSLHAGTILSFHPHQLVSHDDQLHGPRPSGVP